MLESIITSKATRKILGLLFANPDDRFYTRQLERLTDMPVNAVRRELTKLEKSGFLQSKEEGKIKYFWVNKENPIYEEIKSIMFKTQIIGDNLRNLMNKISDIKVAFIYGSVAKGDEKVTSDIDVIVIGNIDSVKLHAEVGKIENVVNRIINYTLLRDNDLKGRKTYFLKRVLKEEKVFLVGSENELRKLA
ncbi:nucleotidyltransferase domain-containing protein [Candidatus Omnitrophota bacterium]